MDAEGKTASQLVNGPAARIHFKRKPAIESGLRNWGAAELSQALRHLQEAVLKSRQHPALEDGIARQALLALALRSARRRA
jgi:DNA polymerase-3 subunit delta